MTAIWSNNEKTPRAEPVSFSWDDLKHYMAKIQTVTKFTSRFVMKELNKQRSKKNDGKK